MKKANKDNNVRFFVCNTYWPNRIFFYCTVLLFSAGILGACKNEAKNVPDIQKIDTNDGKIYDTVRMGDTILVVCDPDGLFFNQPLAQDVSTEWIQSAYPEPLFFTITDEEMYPHEAGACMCGQETFWVVNRLDTLCFAENEDTSGGQWHYVCGKYRDTLTGFGGLKVGMSFGELARRLHWPESVDTTGIRIVHLASPGMFTESITEKRDDGLLHVVGQYNPYKYEYGPEQRIDYAGVELVLRNGRVVEISTGWYMSGSRSVEWGL